MTGIMESKDLIKRRLGLISDMGRPGLMVTIVGLLLMAAVTTVALAGGPFLPCLSQGEPDNVVADNLAITHVATIEHVAAAAWRSSEQLSWIDSGNHTVQTTTPEYEDIDTHEIDSLAAANSMSWSPGGGLLAISGMSTRDYKGFDSDFAVWVVDPAHHTQRLFPASFTHQMGESALEALDWIDDNHLFIKAHCGSGCENLWQVNTDPLSTVLISPHGYEYWVFQDGVVTQFTNRALKVVYSRIDHSGRITFTRSFQSAAYNELHPGSNTLALTSWSAGTAYKNATSSVTVWDPTEDQIQRQFQDSGWATWSPDGKKVAMLQFSRKSAGWQTNLAVHSLTGETVKSTLDLGTSSQAPSMEYYRYWSARRPQWSPDGHLITLLTAQGDLIFFDPYSLSVVGSVERAVPNPDFLPRTRLEWSPSGKAIYLLEPALENEFDEYQLQLYLVTSQD